MNYDFGASWYFVNDMKSSPLDKLFTEVLRKIAAYDHHTIVTTELYEKEKKELQQQISEEYEKQMQIARPVYQKILSEQGESEWAEQFASHESGIDAIAYYHQDEDESVARRFSEITTYFHKSSLTQAYALLESELRMLCSLIQKKLEKPIGLDHLKGGYLDAIWTYLQLVGEIEMETLNGYRDSFSELGTLRNKIMHNGGMFQADNVPKEITDAISNNKGKLSLRDEDSFKMVEVRQGYLQDLYLRLESFFKELVWLVDKRLSYSLLTERFRYLFAFLATDLVTSSMNVKHHGKALQIQFHMHSKKAGFALDAKITLEPSKADSVEVIVQSGDVKEMGRLKAYLEKNPSLLFDKILGPYALLNSNTMTATLLLF